MNTQLLSALQVVVRSYGGFVSCPPGRSSPLRICLPLFAPVNLRCRPALSSSTSSYTRAVPRPCGVPRGEVRKEQIEQTLGGQDQELQNVGEVPSWFFCRLEDFSARRIDWGFACWGGSVLSVSFQ